MYAALLEQLAKFELARIDGKIEAPDEPALLPTLEPFVEDTEEVIAHCSHCY
jgi:hypothetical protein